MALPRSKVIGCLLQQIKNSRGYATATTATAASTSSTATHFPSFSGPQFTSNRSPQPPRQALVQSLTSPAPQDLVTLHPEVYARMPLLHVIRKNVDWQNDARDINYVHEKNKAEMPATKAKVWPQKGTGRARHGSKTVHIFLKGGKPHGLREYTSRYFFLNTNTRILGLTSMLSLKFAQDDLVIVDSLSLPSGDPAALEELVTQRHWGPSVLFCDVNDIMPENITEATDAIPQYNLLPAYGLNVLAMVKHDTLVMTLDAARHVETKLLQAIYDPELQFRDMETVRTDSLK